ncbi:cold shock domain-containing protein [Marinomonas sp. M1K-6]|uniref:Cold shock domain-containing protein n=1 Tax=Marinomonas profundi TaxID=2726122 RepID=A0A847RCY7_9GAMM|nr:cold shock domain-containing protein [Marinomonas profundi]NLQ18050.1 cold shock domain-containing protein [Marinomonas profundi]UDV01771.1 cold shock domain-containing protein [Marinomonas profundi]
MERLTGKVKWFNDAKGVGFIKREEDGDVFVHYKSIACEGHKTLRKGQSVHFELSSTDFGVQAIDVRLEKEAQRASSGSSQPLENA